MKVWQKLLIFHLVLVVPGWLSAAPGGELRPPLDTVGFATTSPQMELLFPRCLELAAPRQASLAGEQGWKDDTAFIAGVCPHDDYCYAGRLYPLVLSRIRAPRVIVFGVFHKARDFDCRDKLVFDSHVQWHGPRGPVAVSPLRQRILGLLPAGDLVVDNTMHAAEHSVEALVPFLQAFNPDVEIVPILVPHMEWETMERLAGDLSAALVSIIREEGWELGRDVALVCSCDAVHYGDAGWGGKNFAPFGAGLDGYRRAVERDLQLAGLLCGPLTPANLETFLYRCVDREDVGRYLVPWCGRFSVPLGLSVASSLTRSLEGRGLTGVLLDYGTSVSEATITLDDLEGMGATAPNNFHHFVGYPAIGYR